MRVAFGLDLAGYSTGKSGLARVELGGGGDVLGTIFSGHSFARKVDLAQPLAPVVEEELRTLRACLAQGPCYVDVPIDLQGLPSPPAPCFAWELVLRPVDYAFRAMPALADRIGAPCARFQHLLRLLDPGGTVLGQRVFETYPSASLKLLGCWRAGYKRRDEGEQARYVAGAWRGRGLADMCAALGFTADQDVVLSDDDFDALICALTGVVAADWLLEGVELEQEIRARIQARLPSAHAASIPTSVPRGFVLLRRLQGLAVHVTRAPYSFADER